MFDNLTDNGLNSTENMWTLIKQKDEGKFDEIQITGRLQNSDQSIPIEKNTDIHKLSYLPDPLARGAALRNLPGPVRRYYCKS